MKHHRWGRKRAFIRRFWPVTVSVAPAPADEKRVLHSKLPQVIPSESIPRYATRCESSAKAKQPRSILDDSGAIEAVWPVAVGRTIARHTSRLRLVRRNLVVDAEDVIWQRQLRALEHQMVERIRRLLPDIEIESIEFRIGVPRREPQTASAASPLMGNKPFAANSADEADRILDPVFKEGVSALAQEGNRLKLTTDEVRYVADFANSVDRKRNCGIAHDLGGILTYVEQLGELNTAGSPLCRRCCTKPTRPRRSGRSSASYPDKRASLSECRRHQLPNYKVPRVFER